MQCNDLIGNKTRDLPACSTVPQPTMLPCAPSAYTPREENAVCYVKAGGSYSNHCGLKGVSPSVNKAEWCSRSRDFSSVWILYSRRLFKLVTLFKIICCVRIMHYLFTYYSFVRCHHIFRHLSASLHPSEQGRWSNDPSFLSKHIFAYLKGKLQATS
jgi:hypothetical protein